MPSKADDSYRAGSRWDHLLNPPKGGFFAAGQPKSQKRKLLSRLSSARSPRLARAEKDGRENSRRDLTLLIDRGPTSRGFAELTL